MIAAGVALSPNYNGFTKDNERTASSSLVVGVAVITIAVETLLIVIRFLNIGLINYSIKLFLIAVSL